MSRTRWSRARKGSPLIVGVGEGEYIVASDASALVEHTRSVIYLDDGEMAVLTPRRLSGPHLDDATIDKPVNQIEWDLDEIELGGYEHFMLKEIFEQPESLANTLRGRLAGRERHRRGCIGLNISDEQAQAHRPDHHHRLRHRRGTRR